MDEQKLQMIAALEATIETHQTIIALEQMSIDALNEQIRKIQTKPIVDDFMNQIYNICKP